MEEQFDYEGLVKSFYEIEKDYNLYELKDQGTYVWKLVRFYVFLELMKKKQNIQSVHLKESKFKKVQNIISVLSYSITKNPFFKKKKESIIIDHPRKVKYENGEIDPYTYFYFKDMDSKHYEVLERRYVGQYRKSLISTNSTMDFFSVMNNLLKLLTKKKLSASTLKKLKEIEVEIKSKLNVSIEIRQIANKKFVDFHSMTKVFEWYLKIKRPKKLYVVVSYILEPYVAAAKKLGIKVIEFQHGVMGPFHVGYHFPYTKDVPYFPDEILMFGKFWGEVTRLPNNTQKTYVGYPYLKEHIDSYSKMKMNKSQKQVTIISQGTIGKKLSEMMYLVARELPHYRFMYKLHPGEFGRWKKEYSMLVEMEKLPNVTIIENETPLYDLFAQSAFVIGVNSTAIFEAIAFNLKPIIVTLPSYEMMKVLHEKHHVPLVNTAAEAIDYLLTNQKTDNLIHIDEIFEGMK